MVVTKEELQVQIDEVLTLLESELLKYKPWWCPASVYLWWCNKKGEKLNKEK